MRLCSARSLLLLAVVLAPLVQAQAFHILNRPLPEAVPLNDLLGGRVYDLRHTGGNPVSDTTASWRYYPLAVGDVREYEDDEGYIQRATVEKDTTVAGRAYFVVRQATALDGEVIGVFRRVLRFDTASATVLAPVPGPPPSEVPAYDAPCLLDAPFDTVAECYPDFPFAVTGTYDGVLVFGGDRPGTGTDTVRTAVKRYTSLKTGYHVRYGAGVGIVYEEGDGFWRALTYYRVGGEEHGVPRFPVAAEPAPPVAAAPSLEAWPNPSRGRLTVLARGPSAAEGEVAAYDILGRVVRRVVLGPIWAEEQQVELDLSGLPAGSYMLVLQSSNGSVSSRFITLLH